MKKLQRFYKSRKMSSHILASSGDFDNLPLSNIDKPLCLEGQKEDNLKKNRYTNVLPPDSTRVKINGVDYINANYIDLCESENTSKKIIACQGPLKNTEQDFWTMILENKTPVILMLTKTFEKGKIKCSNYYPLVEEECIYQDGLKVKNNSVERKEGYVITELEVTSRGLPPHKLKHIYYYGWPDCGVPPSKDELLNILIDYSKICVLNPAGIPVCHCSAGLGRTGTVIAILRCLETKENVKDAVAKLRKQRHGMVQTKEQYRFILNFLM
ncbi:MAG TPA: protein-tyrosine phosphatase family protein [Saprospiraceae bacterium]|nr:protein-tyrosine phosphatase family protein [Saprospiraceae bacterium]